jgi:malonyl-CoA decarboxylase
LLRKELKRISIDQTPRVILEKIASRDAVHPIKCTDDLKKRLSTSRRCYALFHHSIPNEPLVILHTAMLDRIPSNLDDLNRGKIEESVKNQVAVFYSITNAFPGLVGLDLGCFLIKSVLKIIDSEYQDGDTVFVTLSPIPGFRKWLVENKTRILNDQDFFVQTADEKEQMMTLLEMNFDDQLDSVMQQKIKLIHDAQPILMRLAAHYLYHEKENKLPLDKVARFHMRNGASIFRLNFFADTSTRGMSNRYYRIIRSYSLCFYYF